MTEVKLTQLLNTMVLALSCTYFQRSKNRGTERTRSQEFCSVAGATHWPGARLLHTVGSAILRFSGIPGHHLLVRCHLLTSDRTHQLVSPAQEYWIYSKSGILSLLEKLGNTGDYAWCNQTKLKLLLTTYLSPPYPEIQRNQYHA